MTEPLSGTKELEPSGNSGWLSAAELDVIEAQHHITPRLTPGELLSACACGVAFWPCPTLRLARQARAYLTLRTSIGSIIETHSECLRDRRRKCGCDLMDDLRAILAEPSNG